MGEDEMIQRVINGDEVAFSYLVKKYRPIVERFAFQFGLSPEETGDITQEVFIRVFRSIEGFQGAKFTTWLYQITLNLARDYFRKQKRDKNRIESYKDYYKIQNQVDRPLFSTEEKSLLHLCIQQLDEKYKVPIILYYFHDKTYDEIAQITKKRLSAIKTRIHRGKKMIRELYEKLEVKEGRSHG